MYYLIVILMKYLFNVKVIYVMIYYVNHLNMSMKKGGQWRLFELVCFVLIYIYQLACNTGVRASNQPTTVEGLFSNGYDLVEYFMRDANVKMSAYMNEKSKK
jgi:hypothetical protein